MQTKGPTGCYLEMQKNKKISKQIIVAIIGKEIMEKEYIKYLGILIDNEGILIIPY